MEAIKSFENILAALDVNCFMGSDSQTLRKSEVTNECKKAVTDGTFLGYPSDNAWALSGHPLILSPLH